MLGPWLKSKQVGQSLVHHIDCMQYMRSCKDNEFDLAIIDPPYGLKKGTNATSRLRKYGQIETVNDMKPSLKYFDELFRISKNQIIWGYNHLSDMLPKTSCFIFWYKHQPVDTYADGELAWTSFNKTAKCFDFPFFGSVGSEKRVHPTQKPVKLYEWILSNYAKSTDKIFDSHMGSGSIAIAANKLGFNLTTCEIDHVYYKSACERIERESAQKDMFSLPVQSDQKQKELFA